MTALLIVLLIVVVLVLLQHGQRSLRWMVDDAETDAFLAEIQRVKPPPARADRELVATPLVVVTLAGHVEAAATREARWHAAKRVRVGGAR